CSSHISHAISFGDRPCAHRDLHSFPTRRSSDLTHRLPGPTIRSAGGEKTPKARAAMAWAPPIASKPSAPATHAAAMVTAVGRGRSEEHTSELQSRENLVCRLLLEKKKTIRSEEL